MKTFRVNVAITVFAAVEVEARSADEAEKLARMKRFAFDDLELLDGDSVPQMVFDNEAKEVRK